MKHFLETSNALNALVLNLLDHLDTTQKWCFHGSTAGVSSNFQWSNYWFGGIRLIFQDQFVISTRGFIAFLCVRQSASSKFPPLPAHLQSFHHRSIGLFQRGQGWFPWNHGWQIATVFEESTCDSGNNHQPLMHEKNRQILWNQSTDLISLKRTPTEIW